MTEPYCLRGLISHHSQHRKAPACLSGPGLSYKLFYCGPTSPMDLKHTLKLRKPYQPTPAHLQSVLPSVVERALLLLSVGLGYIDHAPYLLSTCRHATCNDRFSSPVVCIARQMCFCATIDPWLTDKTVSHFFIKFLTTPQRINA